MSFVAVAIGTAAVSTLYGANQQRKAARDQRNAIQAQQEEDARKAAEAETSAQVAANAKLADAKRRRRSSALDIGNPAPAADALGAAGATALASGRQAAATRGASSSYAAGTALGSGSPTSRGTLRPVMPTAPERMASF